MLLEHCHNVINNVYSLRANVLVILWPIPWRNANDSFVSNKATKFGARMNVMPFLEHQILIVYVPNGIRLATVLVICPATIHIIRFEYRHIVTHQILFANAGCLQQLIDVGDIFAAHCLTGSYPKCILRTVPIRFNECRTTQFGNCRTN